MWVGVGEGEREVGRWSSGLFARHRKPAGIRIQIVIPLGDLRQCQNLHYTLQFLSCFGAPLLLFRSGLGRAGDGLCLEGVELGLICFTRRAPHQNPTRARTYATTFFPFPCFVIHSCKVVLHFCDNDVCRRKVLESFEATYV